MFEYYFVYTQQSELSEQNINVKDVPIVDICYDSLHRLAFIVSMSHVTKTKVKTSVVCGAT